ncbi:response regulator transcription factor [Paraconexibacter antarcticus]|uniref:Response regulator transcription factor n=1 Tax=Paraconexibacter antarcticus TaxID=2949664 RepID=A0ABY5DPV6_9ACTN|nr:response regulator transcription factor [Paraconexibacter antarcticus]UTI64068.1 response regulator transcription factor [Paraconexibacter antarcticus]
MTGRIGVCEDDAALRSVLARALADEGHETLVVGTGREAVARFVPGAVDALILDVGLPDADGRDVCQALRAHGVTAPVLFLTARDAVTDRVSGFRAGGDDYLTKPFALAELLVRVQALLKRSPPAAGAEPPAATEAPDGAFALRLDAAAHGIRCGDAHVTLTPTEFRLLAPLVARSGEVVRRRELVGAAWPDGAIVHDNTLDAYITRLRRKLREVGAPTELANVRGVGYVLR